MNLKELIKKSSDDEDDYDYDAHGNRKKKSFIRRNPVISTVGGLAAGGLLAGVIAHIARKKGADAGSSVADAGSSVAEVVPRDLAAEADNSVLLKDLIAGAPDSRVYKDGHPASFIPPSYFASPPIDQDGTLTGGVQKGYRLLEKVMRKLSGADAKDAEALNMFKTDDLNTLRFGTPENGGESPLGDNPRINGL